MFDVVVYVLLGAFHFHFEFLICIHFTALASKIVAGYYHAPVNCFLEDFRHRMESRELSELIYRIKTFEFLFDGNLFY